MADRVVRMDVRSMIVTWDEDAPRGAVTRFCEEHGVSRSRFYEIRAEVKAEGALAAMQPRPRVPRAVPHPQAVPLEVEELAVRIRKELADEGWDHGPVTVRYRLQRLGVHAPAASTLARIFTRHGMVVPQPQKRPRSSYRRFEFAMVHECWQLDAFEWPLVDGTVCAVFQLLDDCSRFAVASHVAPGERARDAITVLGKGISRFQVPCIFLTDNGTALNQTRRGLRSQLVEVLIAAGCKPITGMPGHPQTQGKDERIHATAQRWLRAQPAPVTIEELQALMDRFDEYYNHHRPHQSLGMKTPAQAMAERPTAIAPQPPEPAKSTVAPVIAQPRRVGPGGKISVNDIGIQLGWEHKHTVVTILLSEHTVTIFDNTGHLIRTVALVPGQTYYGNGRPRGGGRRDRNRPH
jgi:putative transposase